MDNQKILEALQQAQVAIEAAVASVSGEEQPVAEGQEPVTEPTIEAPAGEVPVEGEENPSGNIALQNFMKSKR